MIKAKDNTRVRIVIIDDDIPSIRLLESELSNRSDIEICGIADNLSDGESLVTRHSPNLLFLDMEFPEGNGLAWLESSAIPKDTKIVFYTCYQRYIHDALSLKVFDFLLKPFDPAELDVIITRFKRLRDNGGSSSESSEYSAMPPRNDNRGSRLLSITSVINSKIIVNPADIVYFRYDSERKIWECVLASLKRIALKRQTTAETILGFGPDFVRTHKHFIVNVQYVGIINGNECVLLPQYDHIKEIKISKSYRRDLLDRFYDI